MFTEADHDFMTRALQLAALGLNTTSPNPRVGAVVVKDGQIIGEDGIAGLVSRMRRLLRWRRLARARVARRST